MERWQVNLYIVWFSQLISLMSFGFGLPFLPFYIQELGVTDADQIKLYTGILNSAPAITMGIMAPIWGMLADKWGKKPMLLRAVLSGVFILGGMGLATRVEHLIALRVLQGMLTGTVTAASALVASNTPSQRLSYALGFLSSSTFIGFSAGPAIGGLVAESMGYRVSFFIGAALLLIDFFIVLFVVKENKACMTIIEKEQPSGSSPVKVLTLTVVIMLVVLFFMRIARTVFNPYLPLYVQEMRMEPEGNARVTGIISSIAGLMTAASGLTLSRLGDKNDKLMLLRILLAGGIVLSLPLIFISNLWGFAAMYGFFFFAIGGVEPIVMSFTSGNVPPEKRGVLFGIQSLVGSIGWAISPLLGTIVSIRFSLRTLFILIPIPLFLALIALTIYNRRHNTPSAKRCEPFSQNT